MNKFTAILGAIIVGISLINVFPYEENELKKEVFSEAIFLNFFETVNIPHLDDGVYFILPTHGCDGINKQILTELKANEETNAYPFTGIVVGAVSDSFELANPIFKIHKPAYRISHNQAEDIFNEQIVYAMAVHVKDSRPVSSEKLTCDRVPGYMQNIKAQFTN